MREIAAPSSEEKIFRGIGCGGICAVGEVRYYRRNSKKSPSSHKGDEKDISLELTRIEVAFAGADGDKENDADKIGKNELLELARSHIFEGHGAEEALNMAWDDIGTQMECIADPRFSVKTKEIRKKLVCARALLLRGDGEHENVPRQKTEHRVILAAAGIRAAELADLDADMLLGIVFDVHSPLSHEIRVAQSFSVPILAGIDIEALERDAPNGSTLMLDAEKGFVTHLTDDGIEEYARRIGEEAENMAHAEKNIRALTEIRRVGQLDAEMKEEIVLFSRYMVSEDPSEAEFRALYEKCAEMSRGGRVTVQLLTGRGEDGREELLCRQLRAVIGAWGKGMLSVLVPNVKSPDDVKHVRAVLTAVANELDGSAGGTGAEADAPDAIKRIKVGASALCPAAVLLCDELASVCDFVIFDTDALTTALLGASSDEIGIDEVKKSRRVLYRLLRPALDALARNGTEAGFCGFSSGTDFLTSLLVPPLGERPPETTKSRFFLVLPENNR